MKEKHVSQMNKEEVLQWLKRRQQQPLYVASEEHEGMTFCYANPELVSEDEEKESQIDRGPQNFWLFNTDETEEEGEGAYQRMIEQSCIAAWGNCKGLGANKMLQKPAEGDVVFFFCAGRGILASGRVTDAPPVASSTIFGETGEYHRAVENLKVLATPLQVAAILEKTGYMLPYRHIVCHINNPSAVNFIVNQFEKVQDLIAENCDLSDEQLDNAIKQNRLRFQVDVKVSATDVKVLARRRRGQDRLRVLSLAIYANQCAMCDISDEALLETSHIVPWGEDVNVRADLRNIICLCTFHHALFDAGYISLSDKLELLKKAVCDGEMLRTMLAITSAFRIGDRRHSPKPAYLRRHRNRFGF